MNVEQVTTPPADPSLPAGGGFARVVLLSTTATIAVLTFAFSFRNVWVLANRLGIDAWISPLVGPAVDLSVVGLLITVQWLSLAGVQAELLRPARRLLKWCGVITMLLNSALSLIVGVTTGNPYAYGRAAVEAIAPWLLIAWSHVGPVVLRLFVEVRVRHAEAVTEAARVAAAELAMRAVTEPVTSPITGGPIGVVTAPVAGLAIEPVTQPITEPATGLVIQPVTEGTIAPITEPVTGASPDPSPGLSPTALRVARLRAKEPTITQKRAATRLRLSVTTVGRYWQVIPPDTAPDSKPINGHPVPDLIPTGGTES